MPLHRLTEKPTTLATLADLTCDSDGKIDRFVGASGDISSVLPVHDLHEGEPYYLGLFLGGVYQVNGFKTFYPAPCKQDTMVFFDVAARSCS